MHILPGRPVGKPDQMSPIHAAVPVTGSYYDTGRTGHGVDAMLEAVQQDDVSAVIVNDLARLGEKITGTQGTLLLGVMQAHAQATGDSQPDLCDN